MNILKFLMVSFTLSLSGCNSDNPEPDTGTPEAVEEANVDIDPQLEQFVEQARDDLARRMEMSSAAIEVERAELVTWPNGAMGCPEPDMMYTQALVPGYRIRLYADGKPHDYHGARDKPPFYCPGERISAPTGGKGKDDVR